MTLPADKDPFGNAVAELYNTKKAAKIKVDSDITEGESISPSYLFRPFNKMPKLEQLALKSCTGKTMDVGACAGSHALYLQKQNIDITALEISELCCGIMQKRGLQKVVCEDFFLYKEGKFDTLLLLMNGIGIAGTLEGLRKLLQHAKTLLNPGSKIIFDSSDISYMYIDDDGSQWIDLNSLYYGELEYQLQYKEVKGEPFPWLFVDKETVRKIASEEGFSMEVIADGEHYDYLASLELPS